MTGLWDSAAVTTKNWRRATDSWSDAEHWQAMGTDSLSDRTRHWLALLAVLAAALLSWAGYQAWSAWRPHEMEVAVFFPSTSVSAWPDFLKAVRLAAEERDLPVSENPQQFSCTVMTQPTPIRFQWYPAIGSFELQQSAREVCRRTHPPIAIVGANNTSMTEALGREIYTSSQKDWTPLLLMTTATANELIDLVPDRTFRFGFSNQYQAKAVIDRLKGLYDSGSLLPSEPGASVNAVVVQVLDNPFSVDLAKDFAHSLKDELGAKIAPPPATFRSEAEPLGWSLRTATGGGSRPTDEEQSLADSIVDVFLSDQKSRAVLVLPMGGDSFRRMMTAISDSFRRDPRTESWGEPAERLAILSGDSLDYFDFAEDQRGRVSPSSTPGQVLFFAHANPVDTTLGPDPDLHNPSIGLNREVVRTLLDVSPGLGQNATPTDLSVGLSEMREGNDPVFSGRERCSGGGVIVAVPVRNGREFDLVLPTYWATRQVRSDK